MVPNNGLPPSSLAVLLFSFAVSCLLCEVESFSVEGKEGLRFAPRTSQMTLRSFPALYSVVPEKSASSTHSGTLPFSPEESDFKKRPLETVLPPNLHASYVLFLERERHEGRLGLLGSASKELSLEYLIEQEEQIWSQVPEALEETLQRDETDFSDVIGPLLLMFSGAGALTLASMSAFSGQLDDPSSVVTLERQFGFFSAFFAALELIDQEGFAGRFADVLSRLLFASRQRRIVVHEAGHFLVLYLLGAAVLGYCPSVSNPVERLLRPCVLDGKEVAAGVTSLLWRFDRGEADSEAEKGQKDRAQGKPRLRLMPSTRLSPCMMNDSVRIAVCLVALYGGIAAEGLFEGKVKGGKSDRAAVAEIVRELEGKIDHKAMSETIGRLSPSITLGSSETKKLCKAALGFSVVLLQSHTQKFLRLATALREGKNLYECFCVIENS
uniref:Peptidase M41 domain-containing protein n=1 Tax=Chromera velia CCMP2878 TaxID=1169474 RepID=A0A0G4F2A7_9ALVE|eukprot:Cvel_14866.t1-p1 / transcript=Cvel_14866.t1 / gene=Cvel_14866 / organism=Chromera_velia_CCMP2878 / gene_product=hypothetical protein / transcript_product=hypothetical protein / location=Cvel_scaffold1075:10652-11968(-) / protein_length=439 / sequence_SO=supercontig / SO=protein_coding / is_pseudo=false